MASVAEIFKAELLGRLQAAPFTDYGPDVPALDNIRRSHLTRVDRQLAPAIHLRFPKGRPTADKACNWQWALDWTVSVYVRSDDDSDADPLLVAIVNRINPAAPYANNVVVQITDITSDTEIADQDATRVDVNGTAKFSTAAWSVEPLP